MKPNQTEQNSSNNVNSRHSTESLHTHNMLINVNHIKLMHTQHVNHRKLTHTQHVNRTGRKLDIHRGSEDRIKKYCRNKYNWSRQTNVSMSSSYSVVSEENESCYRISSVWWKKNDWNRPVLSTSTNPVLTIHAAECSGVPGGCCFSSRLT